MWKRFIAAGLVLAAVAAAPEAYAEGGGETCPIGPETERVIVSIGENLVANYDISWAQSSTKWLPLPKGRYAVTLSTYDNHFDKPWQDQTEEQWRVVFLNVSEHEITQSSATSDLPENVEWLTETVDGELVLTEDVEYIRALHAAYPDSDYNSLQAVCAAFDPLPPICGNGVEEVDEQCDDGNTVSGDGCSLSCTNEACGNSIVDAGEICDDGNTVNGDGCSETCTSTEICGNGIADAGEQCDDGHATPGDGCSATCQNEVCGNGIIDVSESCDDGNTVSGDGCGAQCTAEICGNMRIDFGEECDDGNTVNVDGCSASCRNEESDIVVSGNGGGNGGGGRRSHGGRRFPVELSIEKQVRTQDGVFVDADSAGDAVAIGRTGAFRITVQNHSNYPVHDVLIRDDLVSNDKSTVFGRFTEVQGATVDFGENLLRIARIEAHSIAVVTYALTTDRPLTSEGRNTATIEAYGIIFGSTGTVKFSKGGLGRSDNAYIGNESRWITKVPSITEVLAGSTVVYTVRVYNIGMETLHGLSVSDKLDRSKVTVKDAPDADVSGNTLTWHLPALAPGESWISRYTVQTKAHLRQGSAVENIAILEGESVAHIPVAERTAQASVSVVRSPQTGVGSNAASRAIGLVAGSLIATVLAARRRWPARSARGES